MLRYILQNPQIAGITASISAYKWSSSNEYLGVCLSKNKEGTEAGCYKSRGITDINFVLGMIDREQLTKYLSEPCDATALDIKERKKALTDAELIDKIYSDFGIKSNLIQYQPKDMRDALLMEIIRMDGVSIRMVSRVTGISKDIICNLANKRMYERV